MTDTVIRMPKLADTLVEGTVGKWLKQVGESVAAGEPLVSIETDKVTTDLSSPAAGAVLELLVDEGQTVAVETPIARIGQPLPLEEVDAQRWVTEPPNPSSPHPPPSAEPWPTGTGQAPLKVTPLAARMLAEHGLSAVEFGGSKRVTRADVLRYLELRSRVPNVEQRAAVTVEPQTLPGNVVPLSGMRRTIAEHMSRARKTIPMGQTVLLADLTVLATWREREKAPFEQREGAALTYTVVFVHALARALKARQQHAAGTIDIGVAVALDAGLIVPVIRGADALGLAETARALNDLASRARTGRLQPGETHGALMTVTNVGSFGNLFASPIVPLEQIGIFGPGIVERRPMPAPDGAIRIGWRCWLTLMFDRRAFDDLAADRFLRSVLELLLQMPQDAHRG